MFSHSRQPLINCDAPPYSVVQACRRVGFEDPEDVRWCRLNQAPAGSVDLLKPATWKAFFGQAGAGGSTCACGQPLPLIEKYTFTFLSGRQGHYYMGQCRRCHTIYWDEPAPAS